MSYRDAFVGRSREVGDLKRSLAEGAGPVWIVGPPGVGKTRLMAELELGQTLISLTGCRSVEDVCRATLADLGAIYADAPSGAAGEAHAIERFVTVCEAQAQDAWLLFDDCASGLEALGELLGRLDEATRRRVALTSTLAPASGAVMQLWPLEVFWGVELLKHRLLERRPSMALRDEDVALYAEIVERVDGLPLAIEIAAGRLLMLKPAQLLARLEVTSGSDASLNQTLIASIQAAWELLEARDRALLGVLALLPSPALAQGLLVTALSWPEHEVADAIEALRERSLARVVEGGVELLHAVRAFALRQGADEALREALVAELARRSDDLEFASEGSPWLLPASLDAPALEHLLGAVELTEALDVKLKLLLGASILASRRGDPCARQPQLLALFEQLERDASLVDVTLQVRCCRMLSNLVSGQWDTDIAERFQRHIDALLTSSPAPIDAPLERSILWQRAEILLQRSMFDQADEHLCKAEALSDTEVAQARCLELRARQALLAQRFPQAEAAFISAEALLGDGERALYLAARIKYHRAFFHQMRGEPGEVAPLLSAARELFDRSGHVVATLQTQRMFAELCVDLNRPDEARRAARQLIEQGQRHGLRWALGAAHLTLALVEAEHGELEAFGASIERAAMFMRLANQRAHVISIDALHALVMTARGAPDLAIEPLRRAYEELEHINFPLTRAYLHGLRAIERLRAADPEQAQHSFDQLAHEGSRAPLAATAHALLALLYDLWSAAPHRQLQRRRAAIASHLGTIEREATLRVLWAGIQEELTAPQYHRLQLTEGQPDDALVFDTTHPAVLIPDVADWVELEGRQVPWRLLCGIAQHRLDHPDAPIPYDTLQEIGWPGEVVTPESARNRLHVTLNTLRELGLRDLLLTHPNGLLIPSSVQIVGL